MPYLYENKRYPNRLAEIILQDGFPYSGSTLKSQRVLLYEDDEITSIQDIFTNNEGEFPVNLQCEDPKLNTTFCCRKSHTIVYGSKINFANRIYLTNRHKWKYRVATFVNVPIIFRFWYLLLCCMILMGAFIGIGFLGYGAITMDSTVCVQYMDEIPLQVRVSSAGCFTKYKDAEATVEYGEMSNQTKARCQGFMNSIVYWDNGVFGLMNIETDENKYIDFKGILVSHIGSSYSECVSALKWQKETYLKPEKSVYVYFGKEWYDDGQCDTGVWGPWNCLTLFNPKFDNSKKEDCRTNSLYISNIAGIYVMIVLIVLPTLYAIIQEYLRLNRTEYIDMRKIKINPDFVIHTYKREIMSIRDV